MIRWRFIITRLSVVAAILYVIGAALSPIARYVTCTGLQYATGAKVEIAGSEVGLFPPRVVYRDIQVADPRDHKANRNAISADRIELLIDGDALLHRRWVAKNGSVRGLKIGSSRSTSGHFDSQIEVVAEADDSPSALTTWLSGVTGQLSDTATTFRDDLETVRRSQQIRRRWTTDYEALLTQAKSLQQRIETIRDRARGFENPLRDWEQLKQTVAEAKLARQELLDVRAALDRLPQQFENDFASMEEARRIDLEKIDAYVPGDLAGADKLGVDLVADAIRAQIETVRGYIDGSKAIANYTVVAPENQSRQRGETFVLDAKPHPEFLIRRCEIDGLLRRDGDEYIVSGIVENLTRDTALLDEPTRARLRLEGPETLRVDYVRDRRMGNDHDVVTLHWPDMRAQSMSLGKRSENGRRMISVDGGQRELWVQLRTRGEHIDGRMVSKQSGVEIDVSLDEKFANTAAGRSLAMSLSEIDRIEIDANFTGTWRDIDLDLETNLGKALRLAARQAVQGQVAESKAKLTEKVAEVHSRETEKLRVWMTQHQNSANELLAKADASIEEMSRRVMDEMDGADYIGRLNTAIRGKLR